MTESKKILYILLTIGAIFALPYAGAFIQYGHDFPKTLFIYPAIAPLQKASFNIYIFIMIAVAFLGIVLLYIFPPLFGFKKITSSSNVVRGPLPRWFWINLAIWSLSLILLWGRFEGITWFLKFVDIALWWSFSFMIDGWVYSRTGGKSLWATRPRELMGIAVASILGWMIFEYINFFVHYNWYYPISQQIPSAEFLCYSMLASSAVFPISFEFYSLFNTFDGFKNKYSLGPKIQLPKWLRVSTFMLCLAVLVFMSFYPDEMFFAIWIAPLAMLALLLDGLKIWTPFTLVKQGDWSPLLLIALSWVAAGLCVECWNYFSAAHPDGGLVTTNTFYWAYSVPYVNVAHIFEMPVLGYLGYLPYGIYAGLWWITFAYLLNIPTQFSEKDHRNV